MHGSGAALPRLCWTKRWQKSPAVRNGRLPCRWGVRGDGGEDALVGELRLVELRGVLAT
jgi:hypothetical protein